MLLKILAAALGLGVPQLPPPAQYRYAPDRFARPSKRRRGPTYIRKVDGVPCVRTRLERHQRNGRP